MGWQIDDASIKEGLRKARHPGRFEVIHSDPLMILDGAHNPDGAEALSATLRACMGGTKPVAVMGFSADKPYRQMLQILGPEISGIIATGISHTRSGAIKPQDIVSAAEELGITSRAIDKHEDALSEGLKLASKLRVPLLVCGSLYLIGEIRGMILREGGADSVQ
jgi:dihydrofolate synthase/folylpolyglutamate synthase